ncbi:amidase [Tenuifilum thalassicum]|uniref:Amidase n=1 Tax=Tenuifilum thalassicum TaxID=2590900 RepID=A0A7D3XTP6_9BACT|nr:amidase [Tenuifilum thalassicum]QKG79031.1 amidase [Tenuifilum thalassicum]
MKLRIAVLISIAALLVSCQSDESLELEKTAYLEEITIKELHDGYINKRFTIEQVVGDYLKRIELLDKNGPCLNSIISINPNAIKIAQELDKELAEGHVRGPLHGIPVVLKDNIETSDSMPTTAGATVLKNSFVGRDSKIAEKLREAGAVIIGKSNLSEWANFRSSRSSSGWSGVGGQTRNPYVLDRNPCGSSSGSGVAVSANLCAFAIGTETDGSIVCPSNNNGVVGLKPTVGLISRTGIIPISFTQDTPGPMCRSVEDVAISLGTMVGPDSSDQKTLDPNAKFYNDYTQFLQLNGLKGKRLGYIANAAGFHHKVDTLMNNAIKDLQRLGAVVVNVNIPIAPEVNSAEFEVLLYEFKDGLNNYFSSLGDKAPVKNLEELIIFNKNDSIELQHFDQQILELAQRKGDLNSPEYKHALETMQKGIRESINRVMNENDLDLLILPTGSPAWKTDLVLGDHYIGGNSSYAAMAGYPSITVPMGDINGLPVGISFIGRAWDEPLLIEATYSYEQGTKHRKNPMFMKH